MQQQNNSPKSIFTDVRYAYAYARPPFDSDRPNIRRSLSDSTGAAQASESPPNLATAPLGVSRSLTHWVDGLVDGVPSTRDRTDDFRIPHAPLSARKRSADLLNLEPTPQFESWPEPARSRKKRLKEISSKPNKEEPPSPLFFSNSPQQERPRLPPRFSSSEAAARMLSKAQGEERNVKTVTLARGTFASAGSPPTPSRNYPRSRLSSEHHRSDPRSPDPCPERPDALRLLHRTGVAELLDADPRPTFVIDFSDHSNPGHEQIQVLYANPAFLQQPSYLDQDRLNRLLAANGEPQMQPLRAWILARSQTGQPLDKSPSSHVEGNVLWSASTLRGRLRVISASPLSGSLEIAVLPMPSPVSTSGVASSAASNRPAITPQAIGSPLQHVSYSEPLDYFGIPPEDEIEPVMPRKPTSRSNDNRTDALLSPSKEPKSGNADLPTNPGRYPAEEVLSAACASSFDNWNGERELGFFDWTRLPISDALPKHIQFARSIDWAATSLGSIETWTADLRQMCNLIMASPHPAAMYWGEDLVAIYNEAYVMLAGQKHPRLMGQSYREAWAEIWDEVKDVFANAQTTGQATMKDDDCLFIKRNDFLEETYFSWSIIPMVGGDGSVMGLYNPAFEKSRRKIAERRMLTLREVGERTAAARDVKSFWAEVLAALECNEFDTPFVLLYSLHAEAEPAEDASMHSASTKGLSSRPCCLEGALGVPPNHIAAPEITDLQSNDGYAPILREVQRTNRLLVLDASKNEIPEHLLQGLDVRGFGDPVQSVVICPIHPTTGESTLGFLILGVNPRRPFDDDYNLFVQLLGRQLATSLASVVLFEEEIKRGQHAAKMAALDRIKLSEQLAARTQEARDSETKFTRMAEFVPVGVFIASSEGIINYCNDSWYEITRVPQSNMNNWMNYVMDEDRAKVDQLWHDLVENKKQISAECRFKTPWTDRNGVRGDTWVIFSAYPERDEYGDLKSVFGSITNISTQKWAEGLQKRKMEEAVELKRQQENFIDMTSHEMRNPLSAILQCADEIILSLGEEKKKQLAADGHTDTAYCDDNIDAAHTIALCAQHQKRIVDDILTLSKLDSALLMVTPTDVQPVTVAQRALKMFEGEVQNADIDMRFFVDRSFSELAIDWCRFDPSRVLQVLINLTTNAIKFTSSESSRSITITLAASTTRFSQLEGPVVSYFPTRSKATDKTQSEDWGEGEEVYLQFAVRDTGRGLSSEEKKLLFLRFSQASPRTHVQYGGSGLGLFISRELTELQGGEIGVASEAGKGSTFAFYIKARRTPPPSRALAGSTVAMTGASRKTAEQTVSRKEETGAPGKNAAKGGKNPLRILIVEDNLVNQRVLQKQLLHIGCETHLANHGVEALEKLRASWFWSQRGANALELDIVLMDQEMPVMDGLTCTRKIRQMEQEGKFRRHIPVIAVTANARIEQINTAMDAGMDDVVSKPFRIAELIPKVEELIERYPEQ